MSYFVREHTACANKYNEGDILKMLDFLTDIIFVHLVGEFFNKPLALQWAQIVPQLADLFLDSYEAEIIQ